MPFRKLCIGLVLICALLFILSRVGSHLAIKGDKGNRTTATSSQENNGTNTKPGAIVDIAPQTGKTLLGFIPSAPDATVVIELLTKGDPFKTSRSLGAKVLYWYIGWKDTLNGNWSMTDRIVPKLGEGTKSAVVISIINTTVLSSYPNGYKTFSDKGFADDYASFMGQFAKKYNVDYLFVGNEVNTYLNKHPNEVDTFESILQKAYTSIKAARPQTKVGVTISFRDDRDTNFALTKRLAKSVDLIGYTVYGYTDPNFQFEDPQDGITILKEVPHAVPGKSYAIVETGWNTGSALGSSEQEQAEFVTLLRKYIPTSNAEFINWFILRDGKDCTNSARAFLPPGTNPPTEVFDRFKQFLCNFGVYRADGTPKEAVNAWTAPL